MRIFITGASGFIGGAIAKALATEQEVLAMSRSQRSDERIGELGAQPVRCELATLEPGDQTLAPEITAMVEKGAFMWIDGGRARTSTTHIDNLVHAAKLVLGKGKGGQAYFVTDGEVRSFREFLPAMMAAYGVELGEKSMPSAIVRPIARLVEGIWRLFKLGSIPPITRHAIDLMCCDCTLKIDRIVEELGYRPLLSVEENLRQLKKLAPPE